MKDYIDYKTGKFGEFGGMYIAETLVHALKDLEREFYAAVEDESFKAEYLSLMKEYVGRPSPLYFAKRLTEYCGGAKIYLKREDLNHTGAHKVNNTIGQALLARRMGKRKLIAETGAGMHGVATATVAALFGMECDVFMGAEDVRRQAQNAARIKMLGGNLVAVEIPEGEATLKDAMNEALRTWVARVEDTFYVIGTAAGPHPYPLMVKEFQSIIGREAKRPNCGVCGWRQQRNRHFRPVYRKRRSRAFRRGGCGRGRGNRNALGEPLRGNCRRSARQQNIPFAGRTRTDKNYILGIGGA